MGRGVNKFAQTIATAKLMSDVDGDRSMIGGDASNAASWVLAHFRFVPVTPSTLVSSQLAHNTLLVIGVWKNQRCKQ